MVMERAHRAVDGVVDDDGEKDGRHRLGLFKMEWKGRIRLSKWIETRRERGAKETEGYDRKRFTITWKGDTENTKR